MMTDDFLTLVRGYLSYAGEMAIAPDTPLRDLGLDSMRAIELLFAIEDTYSVMFPDEMLTDATFETAESLWEALKSIRPPLSRWSEK